MLLVVLVGSVLALPSFFPVDPALMVTTEGAPAVGVTGRSVESAGGPQLTAAIRVALENAGVTPVGVSLDEQGAVRLRLASLDDQQRGADALRAALDDAIVAFDLAPRLPRWLAALGLEPIRFGLDLRGGVHFVYQVDLDDVERRLIEAYAADVRAALSEARVRADVRTASGRIVVEPVRDEDFSAAYEAVARIADPFGTGHRPWIDTANANGRRMLELAIPAEALGSRRRLAMEQNMTSLRNRIDAFGVTEPVVQLQGESRIMVQVPGVQDPAQLDRVLGSTATLEWRLADMQNDPFEAARSRRVPQGSILRFEGDGTPRLLRRQVIASGEHLTSATSGYSERGPAVFIRLGGVGASRMLDATQANLGKLLAVLKIEEVRVADANAADGYRTERREEVIFHGRIDGVFSTQFQLSGGFSPAEARELALVLRSGALAAPFYKVYSGTVSASLGQDNLDRGRLALIAGLIAVLAFMVLRYRGFGLITNAALLANLILMIGVLALLGAALTLPGMAGILLTLGMAVDANVLINERIREELRQGLSPRAAIVRGYEKAWSSIADANVTTLIAGIVLLGFGTGPIKNFAVTLSLGIVTSMFTAVVGTRTLVELWYGKRRIERLSLG